MPRDELAPNRERRELEEKLRRLRIQRAVAVNIMMQLKVKRLNPAAILPSYAREGDAGLDLFAVKALVHRPWRIRARADWDRHRAAAGNGGARFVRAAASR